MQTLLRRLSGNFVLLNLGAGADVDYKAPPEVLKTCTVVELDGGNQPIRTSDVYHRKHRVTEFVSGRGGPRTFFKRAFWGCSGLAATNDEALARYGVDKYYHLETQTPIQTRALADVIASLGITRVDFLKTDLEGIDFEVVQNMERFLPETLAVQSELRFDPLYEGEAPCEKVMEYMRAREFELVGLKPEFWKPKHESSTNFADGNLVWADFLFLRSAASVVALAQASGNTLPLIKHVLLAAILGKFNHANHLLHRYRPNLEHAEACALMQLIIRFAIVNPALMGRTMAPDFPHVADPVACIRM